jgi:hypothetical protein
MSVKIVHVNTMELASTIKDHTIAHARKDGKARIAKQVRKCNVDFACLVSRAGVILVPKLLSLVSDRNECDNSPCQNGGTCLNSDGSYICNCTEGWEGHECQIGKYILNICCKFAIDICICISSNCIPQ